jgi:hypothetical protein
VTVQVVVTLPLIIGFGALTIDVGRLYIARNELQVSSDSSALAAASAYLSSDGKAVLLGQVPYDESSELATRIQQRAQAYASKNYTNRRQSAVADGDIVPGHFDFNDPSATLDRSAGARFNAVEITLRRADGANGPVEYLFAPIFGLRSANVSVTATAAVDDRLAAYDVEQGTAPMLPFTISTSFYDQLLATGSDRYAYSALIDLVTPFPDNIREVDLYPLSSGAGANFGVLHVGSGSLGTPPLNDQILNNLPPEDIEYSFNSTNVTFTEPDGDPVSYSVPGEVGLRASLEDEVFSRVGDVVGVFVYSAVSGAGATATFTVVGIRFVRVMHIDLTGTDKHLYVQPVVYGGPGVTTHPNAASTSGNVAVVHLVR